MVQRLSWLHRRGLYGTQYLLSKGGESMLVSQYTAHAFITQIHHSLCQQSCHGCCLAAGILRVSHCAVKIKAGAIRRVKDVWEHQLIEEAVALLPIWNFSNWFVLTAETIYILHSFSPLWYEIYRIGNSFEYNDWSLKVYYMICKTLLRHLPL